MTEFDVIFPLNFGAPAQLPANLAIAATALRESRRLKLPIFFAPKQIFDFGDYPNQFSSDFAGYISTVKQVRALAAAAAERGWRRVLIIAAPAHIWRALRDVRAQGLSAANDDSIRAYPRSLWYSKRSTHRQTTSWWRWWFTWELPARAVILVCRGCYERRALH
ncbi:MAG TPA: hypothetical protein VKS22_11875 [Candidatus Binataceae bacterium]|nr:hypothetical protein [Candidatus Binataceae bacterium]